MTIMRVSLVGASLSADQKQDLAGRLISTFAKVEVGQENPAVHGGFLVHFDRAEPHDVYVGGASMVEAGESGRAALVTAQVMAGPWTPEMKARLFQDIEEVVRDAADMPRNDPGADFWMTIVEVPEGGWGYGGKPVSIGSLAPAFAADRQERIREYLAGAELSARPR